MPLFRQKPDKGRTDKTGASKNQNPHGPTVPFLENSPLPLPVKYPQHRPGEKWWSALHAATTQANLSLAEIAAHTGATVSVVRRIVGKLDRAGIRRRQEET